MIEYKQNQKITDLIDITQEELSVIEANISIGEIKTIYSDEDIRICILKERRNKIHRIVFWYGDKPFTEIFKEMVKIAYPN
ncbi:hypothetical protein [Clostridium sp. CF012]|uniref:hypothetical protein n=1 Tax=Clostridium sp. CF012 TaxID=2843319 RepID=UPI001C0AB2F9|nr:hypothetical protein [Clostridium sp. CF012]MBU3142246.1 hypothetical protein [Clostridium sp. CF012]